MRAAKAVALIPLWAYFFAAAAFVHLQVSLFRFPGRWVRISRLVQRFSRLLVRLLRIQISVAGELSALSREGAYIVANHVSYIDGIVLSSLFPLIFVSKREVRGWPIMGPWARLCGTVFIDRQRKDKIPALVDEIAGKLREGANMLVFPEGTSTNGETLLPFQSAPFAAPLRTLAAVVPVTLAYTAIDREPVTANNRDRLYWYGDMEFLGHFWNLFGVRSVEVTVMIHPKIDTSAYPNDSVGRKRLARACYERISGWAAIPEQRRSAARRG